MIQIHSIKSRCGSQSETENYHHVVENHVVEIHVSQGIAVVIHFSLFNSINISINTIIPEAILNLIGTWELE